MSKIADSNECVKWGPPKSRLVGKGKCPHKRPRRGRNRPCRQCGWYTPEQCSIGGVRSGAARRFAARERHYSIVKKQGKWTAKRCAAFFGYSETHIRRIWGGVQRRVLTARETARLLAERPELANMNVTRQSYPPHGARVAVAKLMYWVDRCQTPEVDRRMAAIRERQTNGLRRELYRYGRRVRSDDGPEQWKRIRAASRLWLDRMADAGVDPLPVLLRYTRRFL